MARFPFRGALLVPVLLCPVHVSLRSHDTLFYLIHQLPPPSFLLEGVDGGGVHQRYEKSLFLFVPDKVMMGGSGEAF